MKCPVDNETLVMTERSGVEIDYCPRCRGVWLDRGELDKIIDRGSASAAAPAAAPAAPRQDYRESHSQHGHKPYRKKKESFLGELFDF
ncbi:MAG TPA: zf-TFIIB domain-containing protein [Kiloniellaceae bacterium]